VKCVMTTPAAYVPTGSAAWPFACNCHHHDHECAYHYDYDCRCDYMVSIIDYGGEICSNAGFGVFQTLNLK
jgi:hypothetical protein